MQFGEWLWKRGCRHDGLTARIVRHWCENRGRIGNRFRYYNPAAAHWPILRNVLSAGMAEDEAAAFRELEAAFLAER